MDLSNTENLIIINWNSICRVCLNEGSSLSQIIYLNENYNMTYKDMINTCTGVNISSDDDFPQLICSFCIAQLNNALEFKSKCLSSQNMLKKLLSRKKDSINDIKYEEIEIETNPLDFFQEPTDSLDSFEIKDNDAPLEITSTRVFDKNISKRAKDLYIDCSPTPTTHCSTFKKSKRRHLKSEPTNKIHTCPICEKSYNSYGILRHRKTHANTCWKCTIVLNNQEEYDEHMKTHNRTDCPECGKLFETRHQYTQHIKIHTKDKHLCMICGKNFSLASSLNAHIRIHTGEKRYRCPHCDKKFLHWSDRRDHVRIIHTKEKPHECHFCKKRFTSSGILTKHIRVHTGERPHPCTLCDKKFSSPGTLRMHMYTHTGEKKVICQICNKRFTKNYGLKQHMVTHTGERSHLCLVCDKAFTQAHVLRSHMKTHPEPVTPSSKFVDKN